MSNEWKQESLSRLPQQFEKLNANQYIQRKNIRVDESPKEEWDSSVTYICDSRIISKELYESYIELLDSPTPVETTESLTSIETKQVEGGDNQLSVMEAIADLYDLVSKLVPAEGV